MAARGEAAEARRAVGFDWPSHAPVIAKLHEEIDEVRAEFEAVAANPQDAAARDRLEDELGDLLFVAANLTRHAQVDFGAALRRANAKFERRFRAMEALPRPTAPACRVAAGSAGSLLGPGQGGGSPEPVEPSLLGSEMIEPSKLGSTEADAGEEK